MMGDPIDFGGDSDTILQIVIVSNSTPQTDFSMWDFF